jgi:hypothetical protein
MNHALNEEQLFDAKASLDVGEFVYAPKEILEVWSAISPEHSLWELKEDLLPVFNWLKSNLKPNSLVLVMGEAVATYLVVDAIRLQFTLDNVRCVASTSKRVVEETTQSDGTVKKISTFKHVRYRAYFA